MVESDHLPDSSYDEHTTTRPRDAWDEVYVMHTIMLGAVFGLLVGLAATHELLVGYRLPT